MVSGTSRGFASLPYTLNRIRHGCRARGSSVINTCLHVFTLSESWFVHCVVSMDTTFTMRFDLQDLPKLELAPALRKRWTDAKPNTAIV
jgi:hypothetical protein